MAQLLVRQDIHQFVDLGHLAIGTPGPWTVGAVAHKP
jgi:hypothetical protein